MYLRFTIKELHLRSHKPQGIFTAAYGLLSSGDLDSNKTKQIRELLEWFEDNLTAPPDDFDADRAIFWFRSDAHENIQKIWELVNLLKIHDHFIEVYKCRELGNVVYRDKFQVAAYPSDKDGKIIVQ